MNCNWEDPRKAWIASPVQSPNDTNSKVTQTVLGDIWRKKNFEVEVKALLPKAAKMLALKSLFCLAIE